MTAAPPLRVPVLMYHEIADTTATPSRLAVSPEVFADQLGYLRDAGFTAITAGALSAILAGGAEQFPERPVVLTFDDGYGDFYRQALPLLKQNDLTGTVFTTTGWIGLEGKAKRMLTWAEMAEAAQSGIEIGAHTCTHPQLDQLPEKQLREELGTSKSLIEDQLQMAIPGVAYPFGYSNSRVRHIAREVGYTYGYGVGNAVAASGTDRFALPRLTVRRATNMDAFRRMVNGQETPALRWDRTLTSAYSVVRRAKATVRLSRSAAS
jgi:peptidoglycan/xylan/chitin deacetylase (PgdA/CDA1 family)